jgi:hypothetical protein
MRRREISKQRKGGKKDEEERARERGSERERACQKGPFVVKKIPVLSLETQAREAPPL